MFATPLAVVTIPFFHGKPINIWFGIVLAVMISFQLLTGLRVIKVPGAHARSSVERHRHLRRCRGARSDRVDGLVRRLDLLRLAQAKVVG